MPARAIFGKPREEAAVGGLSVSVHLVPVFQGSLVVFDVTASAARGRWLPWAIIDFGQNPYEAASILADDWCDVPLDDLSLVDVMSFDAQGGWELAIVFRAELTAPPVGDAERAPHVFAPGHFDAIGNFDPLDLERWVARAAPGEAARPEPGQGLLF